MLGVMNKMRWLLLGGMLFCLLAASQADSVTGQEVILQNQHIQATFSKVNDTWRSTRLARTSGQDEIRLQSDEFEVLGLNGIRVDVDDYRIVSTEQNSTEQGETLTFNYKLKDEFSGTAPSAVKVVYEIGTGPYLHKTVSLMMKEKDGVDRLQVLRFSCDQVASRGGEGQPVFIGNWFVGMDYPIFYSRHSNGFKNPNYDYTWHYTIELEGGDRELEPRNGLVTLFHFPGYAKKQTDDSWGIISKRAVLGLSTDPAENAELGLLDYIELTRRPARSHLHHNNWYTKEAKLITVDGYVNDFSRTLKENLAKYGAHLDAMVPDDGWQKLENFKRIYERADRHDPLPEIEQALKKQGIELGLWLALDGTITPIESGMAVGYTPAVPLDYKPPKRHWGGQKYFDILDPLYQRDLKKSLRYLIETANVTYMKHDFNHCMSPNYLKPRHAREACLDVTLDLIAFERSLLPDIYINYTNGSTFSPFWLQYMDCFWMQSGDAPANSDWPQISLREGATSYRDNYFHKNFNRPDLYPRPIVPIANFMTHGILFTKDKPFTDFKDTLLDWSNYVVMYLGRGTLLKELYTSNCLFDDAHWEILGRACAWAQKNQDRLLNTVLVGGDCAKGEVYGYISWVGDRAMLTVRNPDRAEQELVIPFDATVYFRGEKGQSYRAKAIYPYVESMPWTFTSGEPIKLSVPGDSVLAYEIEPGNALVESIAKPEALPPVTTKVSDGKLDIRLTVPDEELPRFDLLIEIWKLANAKISINGQNVDASRCSNGKNWTLASYDIRKHRGQTLEITVEAVPFNGEKAEQAAQAGEKVSVEAWVVADRKVEAAAAPENTVIPLPIGQHYRRQTRCLVAEIPMVVGNP